MGVVFGFCSWAVCLNAHRLMQVKAQRLPLASVPPMNNSPPSCATDAPKPKACTGTCGGGGCGQRSPWVIAAESGKVRVLRKEAGRLHPAIAPHATLKDMQDVLSHASLSQRMGQLVLEGSAHDIAWLRAALPTEVAVHVVAEIPFPLLPAWFEDHGEQQLYEALTPLLP